MLPAPPIRYPTASLSKSVVEKCDPAELAQQVTRTRYLLGQAPVQESDWVAQEQPLEIRVNGYPLSVVMRTTGQDEELVTGYLVSEGIARFEHILRVRHCDLDDAGDNVIQVTLSEESGFDPARYSRHLYVSSSCGVCGKRSIEQALTVAPSLERLSAFEPEAMMRAIGSLRSDQPGYQITGGLHAAALATPDGLLLATREDIGRHNAVDKVLGWSLKNGVPRAQLALILSGRASFEMIQKALAARVGTVVSVGGVSSLAVELARRACINLLGFADSGRLNLY